MAKIPMSDPLLSAFFKAREAARERLPVAEEPLIIYTPFKIPSRYALAVEEAAAAKRTAALRDCLVREEALAYRLGRRWYDYRHLSLGDFAASRISDKDYIEAMFGHYSRGCIRLL
jgi:hypothetical protein